MNLFKATTLLVIFCISLIACDKNDAGTGGKAQINVKVINGNLNVPGAEVKVKYNANVFPGTNATYNETDTSDHVGNAVFENLKRGDYYFYSYTTVQDTAGNDVLLEAGSFVNIASKKGETHIVIDFSEENPF